MPYEKDTLSGFGYLSAAVSSEEISAAWSWAALVGEAGMLLCGLVADSESSLFEECDAVWMGTKVSVSVMTLSRTKDNRTSSTVVKAGA